MLYIVLYVSLAVVGSMLIGFCSYDIYVVRHLLALPFFSPSTEKLMVPMGIFHNTISGKLRLKFQGVWSSP